MRLNVFQPVKYPSSTSHLLPCLLSVMLISGYADSLARWPTLQGVECTAFTITPV